MWFADTDYLFNDTCWQDLMTQVSNIEADFVWPNPIWETDWPTGDLLVSQMDFPTVKQVTIDLAVRTRMGRGIGGIQIARGDTVRKIGYCPDFKVGPCDNWNFRGDIGFLRQFEKKQSVALNHVIRIRHSQKGYGHDKSNEVIN